MNKILVKAADYTSIDADMDLLHKGCVQKTNRTVKFLRGHDRNEVLGIVTKLLDLDDGLYAEVELASAEHIPLIKRAEYELTNGLVEKMSIGFWYTDIKYNEAIDAYDVKGIDLYEVSMVAIPANNNTGFIKEIKDTNDFDDATVIGSMRDLITNLNNF